MKTYRKKTGRFLGVAAVAVVIALALVAQQSEAAFVTLLSDSFDYAKTVDPTSHNDYKPLRSSTTIGNTTLSFFSGPGLTSRMAHNNTIQQFWDNVGNNPFKINGTTTEDLSASEPDYFILRWNSGAQEDEYFMRFSGDGGAQADATLQRGTYRISIDLGNASVAGTPFFFDDARIELRWADGVTNGDAGVEIGPPTIIDAFDSAAAPDTWQTITVEYTVTGGNPGIGQELQAYVYTSAPSSHSVAWDNVRVQLLVPEPSTWGLGIIALTGLAAMGLSLRRKSRRRTV